MLVPTTMPKVFAADAAIFSGRVSRWFSIALSWLIWVESRAIFTRSSSTWVDS